jgi:hypothetical protein
LSRAQLPTNTTCFCMGQCCPYCGAGGPAGNKPIFDLPFKSLMAMVHAGNTTTGGLQWDNATNNTFFNFRGYAPDCPASAPLCRTYQAWVDGPASLRLKYRLVKQFSLRGTGPYLMTGLGSDTPQASADAVAMWSAIREAV